MLLNSTLTLPNDVQLIPASSLSLEALADLYTHAFDDYFYHTVVTADDLATRILSEQLLLNHSPLLCVAGVPVGLALLAVRGEMGCCGGFGIVPAQRGRNLSLPLTRAMLDQAKICGVRGMRLIALVQNERAIKTYRRAGFTHWRDLWCYSWQKVAGTPSKLLQGELIPIDVAELLARDSAIPLVPPIWSRDPISLHTLTGLHGVRLMVQGVPTADLILQYATDGTADILSFGASSVADAIAALLALQGQVERIICNNEPATSPGAMAMDALGFVRSFPRCEMRIDV